MGALQFSIRPAHGEDLEFIYSTWLPSFTVDNCFGRMSTNRMFQSFYCNIIDTILSDQLTQVLVACLKDDPNVILAYLVYEPDVIHYAYTKGAFRRLGLAKALVQDSYRHHQIPIRLSFTHQTRMVRDIILKYKDELRYDDALIFKGDPNGAPT